VAVLALVAALSGGSAWAAATIGTAQIKDGAVTTPKIAAGAVKTGKVGSLAITTAKIGDGQVTSAKVASAAVTTSKLGPGAVTTDKLADAQVTTSKLADGQVTTTKIANEQVTEAKLGPNAVSTGKIADFSVRAFDLGALSEVSKSQQLTGSGSFSVTATCPSGSRVLSGGFFGLNKFVTLNSQRRLGQGWNASFTSTDTGANTVGVYAYGLAG
jgi:hypothetical protein